MDPTSREDLSALMDGELADEPTRFLLRRLDHDPDLSATWSRWHMIRACLAADPARMSGRPSGNDFAARVTAVVREQAVQPRRRHHWARYVGGGAIAASVAVAALMLNTTTDPFTSPAPVADASVAHAPPTANVAATTTLADAAPRNAAGATPWLLSRQPTVLVGAQPASANVIYGTGLMQPDYLRRAAYDRNAVVVPFTGAHDGNVTPFSVMLVPEPPPSSGEPDSARH